MIQGDRKIVTPLGIDDAAEKGKWLQLAKAFAEVGDRALVYEKQFQDTGRAKN